MQEVRVRYGPSPTGIPHVGNIRTALFNFLFAKSQNGKFFLRIEDTDQNRLVEGAVDKIKKSLNLLNLHWDDEPVFQSKRLDIYKQHLEILKKKGFVYEEEGAWRFKIQTEKAQIAWQDAVHGQISFPSNVLEEFVIMKSDGFPTYHFASVIDDHLMNISHVFRGDEWISSTPKHLLLYESFGWEPPKFVHLPVILGPSKKKLSKREGAKSVMEFIDEGYLPEALVNFLALLGWSPKDEQEVFSLEELSKLFTLEAINKNSPIFNTEKLDWFNGQWLRKLPDNELALRITKKFKDYPKDKVEDIIPIVKDRINSIDDFQKLAGFFLEEKVEVKPSDVVLSADQLQLVVDIYKDIKPNEWTENRISLDTIKVMNDQGLSKSEMLGSIGISVSGSKVTPPIIDSLEKLGQKTTIQRIEDVISKKKQ